MLIEQTRLPGVLLLTPKRFGDDRGFFSETYNQAGFVCHGIETRFVQDNHSVSYRAGTIRGLHFQAPPRAQAKLVRCVRGKLIDVAVDIRIGSPTYGMWVAAELSAENWRQMLIPVGFAHGFVTRQHDTEVIYKCSDTYDPASEGSIRFDDSDIDIDWGLDGVSPTLSDKDAAALTLSEQKSPFTYEANE